jgi:hypothetical protein
MLWQFLWDVLEKFWECVGEVLGMLWGCGHCQSLWVVVGFCGKMENVVAREY